MSDATQRVLVPVITGPSYRNVILGVGSGNFARTRVNLTIYHSLLEQLDPLQVCSLSQTQECRKHGRCWIRKLARLVSSLAERGGRHQKSMAGIYHLHPAAHHLPTSHILIMT
jgi:hypothetical protein